MQIVPGALGTCFAVEGSGRNVDARGPEVAGCGVIGKAIHGVLVVGVVAARRESAVGKGPGGRVHHPCQTTTPVVKPEGADMSVDPPRTPGPDGFGQGSREIRTCRTIDDLSNKMTASH